MPVNNFILVGIVVGPGEKMALVKVANSPTVLRLAEQQSLNGWRIARILDDRVVMTANSVSEELTFPKRAGNVRVQQNPVRRSP